MMEKINMHEQRDLDCLQAVKAGMRYHKKGDLKQAENIYRQVMESDPNQFDAIHMLGVISHQRGDNGTAVDLILKAIEVNPNSAKAYNNLGLAYHGQGNITNAIESYRTAIIIMPEFSKAHFNLGVAYQKIGRIEDAIENYRNAIKADPEFTGAYVHLGIALKEQGNLEESVASYHKAISVNPNLGEAHFNLGNVLHQLGRQNEAVESYKKTLIITPKFSRAHLNLGVAQQKMGNLTGAIESYRNAIKHNPEYAIAYNNLGYILIRQGKLKEGLESYRQALSIKPDYAAASSNIQLALNYESEITQESILKEALEWDRCHASAFPEPKKFEKDRSPNRKIRIGYVSPDMRKHSVSYFLEPLLGSHDTSAFETFCYSDVAEPDDMTRRLKKLSSHWRSTHRISDQELTDIIRRDDIDILIDLAGHTAKNRLQVFARRPSPIQVTWLGYPNTTGLGAMDYRIVDTITDPINEVSETLLYLPNIFLCYQPPEDAPEPFPVSSSHPITFGNFNNISKMSEPCIKLWSQILMEVPNSKLLLKSYQFKDKPTQEFIRQRFMTNGIDPERLETLPPTESHKSHLSHYAEVDICLDPFPYNGTTTTCEALWMGIPVVTLLGTSHRSRVGASILSRIGLEEYVATDMGSYISIATDLARDKRRQEELRRNMRQLMEPLCDAHSFTHDMEEAFRTIWRDWCSQTCSDDAITL